MRNKLSINIGVGFGGVKQKITTGRYSRNAMTTYAAAGLAMIDGRPQTASKKDDRLGNDAIAAMLSHAYNGEIFNSEKSRR